MAFFGQDDVDAILDELSDLDGAVDVTVESVTVKGVHASADEELVRGQGARVLGKVIGVKVRTGTLPALALDVPITLDGSDYIVRDLQQLGHAVLTLVLCTRV